MEDRNHRTTDAHAAGRTSLWLSKPLAAFLLTVVVAAQLVHHDVAAMAVPSAHATEAKSGANKNRQHQPAEDPALYLPPLQPLPKLKAPSPGNSEAGSPVRGYIYAPPADSGAITNRLLPPSTIRK